MRKGFEVAILPPLLKDPAQMLLTKDRIRRILRIEAGERKVNIDRQHKEGAPYLLLFTWEEDE